MPSSAARRRAAVARAREAVGAAERCPVSRPAEEISLSAEGSSPERRAGRSRPAPGAVLAEPGMRGVVVHMSRIEHSNGYVDVEQRDHAPLVVVAKSVDDVGRNRSRCTVLTCSCTVPGAYWSSSTWAPNAQFAWRVAFTSGFTDWNQKNGSLNVRAVRGGS